MNITRLVVGPLEENTYILEIDNELLIVDPGSEYDKISKVINDRKVLGILITHSHFDHIGALDSFKDIDIYKHDVLEEKEYNIGKFKFDVIFNPGHSKDSVSYYFKKYNTLFSGDFIFYESIGRCDLPTGSISDMEDSINKIKRYDKDMIIYPGHGEDTTLSHEIEFNPYF